MKTTLPKNAKIILIGLNGIGNLILATPIIENIKANLPKSRISVLVLEDSVGVVEKNPSVERTIVYPAEKSLLRRIFFLLKLRKEGYDMSIYPYPNVSVMSALMGILIGAKLKVNFQYRLFGKLVPFLNDISVPVDYDMHDVDKNLAAVRVLGFDIRTKRMRVGFTKADEKRVNGLLKTFARGGGKLIAMHIGSKEQLRIWHAKNFAKVVEALSRLPNVRIVLIGKGAERIAAEKYSAFKAKNVLNLIDKLTIPETTALLKRCRLLIGNDSGPMHMAASVGTQTLIIYLGPHVRRTVPYGKKHVVFVAQRDKTYDDKNLNHIYVKNITPEMVIEKANDLLRKSL